MLEVCSLIRLLWGDFMRVVFNRNALEINGMAEGCYFIRMNSNINKRVLTDILRENLINSGGETEEHFRFVAADDQEYQNLFMGWDGFYVVITLSTF